MRLTLHDLLDAGDWACAEGDADALADVAERLAARLGPDPAAAARRIARACADDLDAASLEWGRLAARLRADESDLGAFS